MTDDEARKLATRIVDTWPTGAKAYVWRDVLADLDAGHAADAYRRCVKNSERPPTPAVFLDAYTAARADTHRRIDAPSAPCERCQGTGYVAGEPIVRQVNGEPYEYTTAAPCSCKLGTAPAHEGAA